MSITFRDLENVRRELMREIRDAVGRLIGYTLVSVSTSLGEADAVEKGDGAVDPDGKKGQRPVVRCQPFGFNGRPPTRGVRAFWFRFGSSNVIMLGIGPTEAYGPQDLDEGETAQYNGVPNTLLKMDGSGNVLANSGTPDGGAQGDVVVNGGTAKVGRVGDNVDMGTFQSVISAVGPVITVTLNWIPPGGGAPQPLLTFSATGTGVVGTIPTVLTGKISTGANNFKG